MFCKKDRTLIDNSLLELKRLSLVNNVSFVGVCKEDRTLIDNSLLELKRLSWVNNVSFVCVLARKTGLSLITVY